jgi:hypothetical protein
MVVTVNRGKTMMGQGPEFDIYDVTKLNGLGIAGCYWFMKSA